MKTISISNEMPRSVFQNGGGGEVHYKVEATGGDLFRNPNN